MTTYYYMTDDEDIRQRVMPISRNIVFTRDELARAFNVTVLTIKRRIESGKLNVNLISKEKAKQYGKAVKNNHAALYNIEGEDLTVDQIHVKYNVPVSTVKEWNKMKLLDENIIMRSLTPYSVVGHATQNNISASIFKYATHGVKKLVRTSYISNVIKEEYHDIAESWFLSKNDSGVKQLKNFYNVLKNCFNFHIQKGKVIRHVKLCFVSILPGERFKDYNITFKSYDDMDVENRQVLYRTIKPIKTSEVPNYLHKNVKFFSFEEFFDQISGFNYNPESFSSDAEGCCVMQNFALNINEFILYVEHDFIGRSNIQKLRKNLNCISVKNPYYVIFDSNRPYHKKSCFFDAIKILMAKFGFDYKILKEKANQYPDGIHLEEIGFISDFLGAHIRIYGDKHTDQTENLILEYIPKSNEYGVVFDLYFRAKPEGHYSAILGVKDSLIICEKCRVYFATQSEFKDIKHCCVYEDSVKLEKELKNTVVNFYYDLETVNDTITQDVVVYSVAYKWTLQEVGKDEIYTSPSMCYVNTKYTKCCLDKMVSQIIELLGASSKSLVNLIAYNGSSFDSWVLLKKLAPHIKFSQTIYNNSKFYKVTGSLFTDNNKKIRLWDPFLFWGVKLEKLAKDFNLVNNKLGFNHQFIQALYEKHNKKYNLQNGVLTCNDNFDWVSENIEKQITEYNIRDVDILHQICEIMYSTMGSACLNKSTISSFAYSQMKKLMPIGMLSISKYYNNEALQTLSDVIVTPSSENIYNFFRKAITGGRTQTIKKLAKFFSKNPSEFFSLIDVVSLYPYVMRYREYPVGMFEHTLKYVCGKLGIYNVTIKHQDNFLNPNNCFKRQLPIFIPLKIKNKPLDWEHKGLIQDVNITSVEIEILKKYFGCDSLIVNEGYYWEKKSDSLFNDYIDNWIQIKKHQDFLKETGSPEYNLSLRNMAKKMLNCPYGKLTERVHDTATYLSSTVNSTLKITQNLQPDYTYSFVDENLELIEGKPKKLSFEGVKPIQMGVFVLAYARIKMYEDIFIHTDVYYSDTDSALIKSVELKRLQEAGIIKIGKELGEYDVELSDISDYWSIQPKFYALKTPTTEKIRMKGISIKSGWEYYKKPVDVCDNYMPGAFFNEDDMILVDEGSEITLKVFDYILENPSNIFFHTSHFHHRKTDLALEHKTIVKKLNT